MPITSVQRSSMEEVISALLTATAPRGKRPLSSMFMELVDRTEWPEYYQVIPEPRCLNNIKSSLEKGRYKDATDVYTDLSLVFWNALFYNEPGSQIVLDAQTLMNVLETEWKKRSVLPIPRSSPPPSSAQKVHKATTESSSVRKSTTQTAPQPVSAPAPSTLPVPTVAKAAAVTPATSAPTFPTTPARTATPNVQHIAPQPSTSSFAYGKPVAIRPKSTQHLPTPDMDVDVVSSEQNGHGEMLGTTLGMERDVQSEKIVKQLEKGLPRWAGPGDKGWAEELSPDRIIDVVQTIKSHKDIVGNRLSVALDSVPEESTIPNLSYTHPISLKMIEAQSRNKSFKNAKDFDIEMSRLFEKARRWHEPSTEPYGRVLLLQRLYQALTSANPPPGPPYLSSTNFSSFRAGPGSTKLHGSEGEGVPNVTTHRVLTKDRTFVDELHYKGWSVKLADWLHMSNPDDPSRPVITQVFRCWISDEPSKKGQAGVTVSWYYRPEQTFHPSNRKFWEGEVFKTSHFAEHPLEDIIEKIACQFTARHIRGRPRPPYWYPGWPLYVCDSRYNDRERVFVKIKNWNSCVPEEVRKSVEFMPIYPFERTVFPARVGSPFLAGKGSAKGPGGLIHGSEMTSTDELPDGPRKRAKRTAAADATPSKNNIVGTNPVHQTYGQQQLLQTSHQKSAGPDRSVVTAAGGLSSVGSTNVEKLSPEITKYFDRDPDTGEVLWFSAPPMNIARIPPPRHSLAYLHFLAKKRKVEQGDRMEVDHNEEASVNENRSSFQPTVRETMMKLAKQLNANLPQEP